MDGDVWLQYKTCQLMNMHNLQEITEVLKRTQLNIFNSQGSPDICPPSTDPPKHQTLQFYYTNTMPPKACPNTK